MAGTELNRCLTVFPGADADVDGLGKFVVINGSDGLVPTVVLAGDGVMPDGVIYENVVAGDTAPMGIPDGGIYRFLSGAAVTAGANVGVDANGKGVTATSGEAIVGVCTKGTSGPDEFGLLKFMYKGEVA